MLDMKQDLRDIKIRLLDPDKGTISKVNRNTSFRKATQKTLWSICLQHPGRRQIYSSKDRRYLN